MAGFKKPKIVIDPLLGLIDITDIEPLLDVTEFQSLGFKYQLGLASAVFPAATHTRKQHCLGSYERTRRLAEAWERYGFITKEQARNLPVYALYHDIGHGPFCHVTENLGSIDHDKRGLQIVERLQDTIKKAGFDYEMIHRCFLREDPLYLAVFDKNLGMEKLDYLERDAFYTIGERPGIAYLAHHIYYVDEKVVVHDVALDQAKDIQDFYIKMSKHVYLRKKSAIIQRLIEKITFYLMKDGLSEQELFELTDFGLLGKFEAASHPKIQFCYGNFKRGAFPKLAVELKYNDTVAAGEGSKLMKTIGVAPNTFDALVHNQKMHSPKFLEQLERELAKLVGIPEHSVVVVPPLSRQRFEPQDMLVYMGPGRTDYLSNIYPGHFRAMQEYGHSHLSFRIAVSEEHRRTLYDQAEKVAEYILNLDLSA